MKQQPIKRLVFRVIIYLLILASTFYALGFIFDFFNLLYTDIDNARYLLSAMAQSQAAIIAIVITVSLVAVQLGASAYSPRVVSIFKSNPDLWILLALYGTSMSYDFIILKILSEKVSEFFLFISYWLCASAFLALFPYVLSTINILRPEVIVKRLVEDICVPSVGPGPVIGKRWRVGDLEGDPFQPIVDIARGAFRKCDYETVKTGLRRMAAKVIVVINSCNIEKYRFIPGKRNPLNPFGYFSEYYCKHLEQIGRLFAERDEELTLETIENLKGVAEIITKNKLGTEGYVVEALGSIGRISAQREFQNATERTIGAIGSIAKGIPCEDYTITCSNGHKYAHPYGDIMERVLCALGDVGVLTVKKWGTYELQTVGRNLGEVGIAIAKEGRVNKWRVIDVARIFNDIGIIALNVEEDPTKIRDFILSHYVVEPLGTIGKVAHEEGMVPEEKGVESGFTRVVFALWDVGVYAAIKGFNEAARESAKALAELAILDEEVVGQQLNMLKLREARVELLPEFQEFVGAYTEHLKELRALKDGSQKEE
jgi:hypothetical protein